MTREIPTTEQWEKMKAARRKANPHRVRGKPYVPYPHPPVTGYRPHVGDDVLWVISPYHRPDWLQEYGETQEAVIRSINHKKGTAVIVWFDDKRKEKTGCIVMLYDLRELDR